MLARPVWYRRLGAGVGKGRRSSGRRPFLLLIDTPLYQGRRMGAMP